MLSKIIKAKKVYLTFIVYLAIYYIFTIGLYLNARYINFIVYIVNIFKYLIVRSYSMGGTLQATSTSSIDFGAKQVES